MKIDLKKVIVLLFLFIILISYNQADVPETGNDSKFTHLKGLYLGQKPPGNIPRIFAPGIISTDISEGCSGWDNEMEYFVFQRWINREPKLYIIYYNGGEWGVPQHLSSLDLFKIGDFTVAPDGKTIFFASKIHLDEIGPNSEGGNIWSIAKTSIGWSQPKHIGLKINTKYHESYPCVSSNGNLYFFSRRPGGFGKSDLYFSKLKNSQYNPPENLGEALNTEHHEWDPYISPDEKYLIFCSTMPEGLGSDDLYVSFKNKDGSWGKPVHMGDKINSRESENRPYVSHDGKYLFYASTKSGNRDIYWVSTSVIEELKPDGLDK